MKYIGKERDFESSLGDHGVRKTDYALGRFTSIDPLWEQYYAWTPYHYSFNCPTRLIDLGGFDVEDVEWLANAMNDEMNAAWKETQAKMKSWGTSSAEVGGLICHKRLTAPIADNFFIANKTDGISSVLISNDVPDNVDIEGRFHSHSDGSSFSYGDMGYYMEEGGVIKGNIGKILFIEAGDKRFALEIDYEKAGNFVKENGLGFVEKKFEEFYLKAKGSGRDRTIEAMKKVMGLGDTGIRFYISTDKSKVKFDEVIN